MHQIEAYFYFCGERCGLAVGTASRNNRVADSVGSGDGGLLAGSGETPTVLRVWCRQADVQGAGFSIYALCFATILS
jgi:hypothetical protein